MATRSALRPLARSLPRRTACQARAFARSAPSAAPASNAQSNSADTTHFGFEEIPRSEKESRVGAVFSSVATEYDKMNDLMSFGVHRLWKDHFVRGLNPGYTAAPTRAPLRILDIAGGTGDIAFRMLDHATQINGATDVHITISDINPDMLAEGQRRAAATPYYQARDVGADGATPHLSFLAANAEDLAAVPSASVDLYTVAFGIRNFTNKDVALREAFRVLKPGGVFACLEFAGVTNPLLDAVYKRWSFSAIPLIGQLVAGDRDSYQYLVESIERFPKQAAWRDMIADVGFVIPEPGWEDLTGGIAAIHKGIKPVDL